MSESGATGRRLRIVVPRYGEDVIGGSEALARGLALACAGRGWSVQVLTTTAVDEATWKPGPTAGPAPAGGVRVRRFPTAIRRHPEAFRQLTRGFFRLPARLRPEPLWFAAQGPYAPGLVAELSRGPAWPTVFIPYLYHPTVRGLIGCPRPRILIPAAHDEPALRLRSVGRALDAADALWYSTEEERALVESIHPATARITSAIGTVGIEAPAAVDPTRFRHAAGIEGPYLLYGGRMTSGKGLDDLLAGLRALRTRAPDAQLVLTGEPSPHAAREPGVVCTGRLEEELRWDAIAGAAMIAIPSQFESLSLLALEAWAVGRPCLLNGASPVLAAQARRSGGALTFVGPSELAEAAERLLRDPPYGEELGRAGLRYVTAAHGWGEIVTRLDGLIAATTPGAIR